MYLRLPGFILLLLISTTPVFAQEDSTVVIATKDIVTGLDTPWEILWGPDNHIWMTERYGRISRVDPETGDLTPLITMPEVYESPESGLMGLALHPHFPDVPYLYCSYTGKVDDTTYGIHIARFTYARDTLVDKQILLDPRRLVGGTIHEGCRLLIDSATMTLYATTGDADAFYTHPQQDERYNGKVLRMNLDGSVPEDNPWPGSHVWSKGHRNSQGLTWGKNGILYATEHGTWEADEINIITKKSNYGWPYINGMLDFENEIKFAKDSNTTQPIFSWTPTIAPAGCAYYDHELLPQFTNALLVAVLKGDGDGNSYLVVGHLDSGGTAIVDTTRYFYGQYGRFRDVCIAPDGRVFLSTSNRDTKGFPKEVDDRIVMIYPAPPASVEAGAEPSVSLSPNPMAGAASFVTLPHEFVGASYDIIDAIGRVVRTGTLEFTQSRIERGSLAEGVYILRVRGDVRFSVRFVIN